VGAGGGVLFRGSGFHQTDYRSESYRRDARKDADASKGGETGK
jgi:predicted nucleic acid-binding Zn ribbon protein